MKKVTNTLKWEVENETNRNSKLLSEFGQRFLQGMQGIHAWHILIESSLKHWASLAKADNFYDNNVTMFLNHKDQILLQMESANMNVKNERKQQCHIIVV